MADVNVTRTYTNIIHSSSSISVSKQAVRDSISKRTFTFIRNFNGQKGQTNGHIVTANLNDRLDIEREALLLFRPGVIL